MGFGFFKWLASFFAGGRNNPERARRRELKWIAKSIAANEYEKFFRTKSMKATPDMAQFFYEVYKTAAPTQGLLQNVAQSMRLKLCAVRYFLDSAQLEILERLSGENVEKLGEELGEELLSRQALGEFAELERAFDEERAKAINECYGLIQIICTFAAHGYYFLLKKFDPQLSESHIFREPAFGFLRGEVVAGDLKDFLELASGLDPGRDWSAPLGVLKECMGREFISLERWNRLLLWIRRPVNSEIFELIIRFVEKNPGWAWAPFPAAQEDIVGPYLDMIRGGLFDRLARIAAAKLNVLVDRYAGAVFGSAAVCRLKYYTEQKGEAYKRGDFPGFTAAGALNYLTAFLTDAWPEMQNLWDLLLIRGRWVSTALGFPLSDALWQLGGFPARITALDETLSERGFYGAKLRVGAGHTKTMAWSVARILDAVNGEARRIVNDGICNLSVLYDGLKGLLNDYRKYPGSIILNWGELNLFSETRLEGRVSALLDKLANMLELLRVLIQRSGYTSEQGAEEDNSVVQNLRFDRNY
jgi:hypothetical protein